MPLEICVDSLQSAINAVDGGCDQLELCSALSLGGLTPSAGFLATIEKAVDIGSLMIMIRPREGNFIYSRRELEVMKSDMKLFAQQYRNAGFVIGVLKEDNTLNEDAMVELMLSCGDCRRFTLHRAFDLVDDWKKAVDVACRLGIAHILTSGQKPTAMEGKERLAEIVEYANAKGIEIIVGSGVKSSNIQDLWHTTKASWYHGSASVAIPTNYTSPIPMGPVDSNTIRVTSKEEVALMQRNLSEVVKRF